jgi:heme a synthase
VLACLVASARGEPHRSHSGLAGRNIRRRISSRIPESYLDTRRDTRIASRLALLTTLSMFGLIVLGALVRATGSGLACPDWPLCHGRLLPPPEFPAVVEWLHRLAAAAVSLLLVTTAAWIAAHRALRARLGGLALIAVALLACQILLGALTVWKLLDPGVVGGHLAVALVLFATLLTITLVAESEAHPRIEPAARTPGLLAAVGGAAFLTFAQCILGGMVSTRHAGLACPDWPTCHGAWFPPLSGLVGLQMLHRYGAYVLVAALLLAAWRARSAPDPAVRAGGCLALSLTLAQVVLGVCNVFLGLPPWLSAAHLATAVTILGILVAVTFRTTALDVPGAALAAAAAAEPAR